MQKYKAYAKVNIFLKIVGKRGEYHEILSRFMRVETLYDLLWFEPKEVRSELFEIHGEFSCPTEQNTLYKAYIALKNYTKSEALEQFMQHNAVVVEKKIPAFAGLGGGSSDAATYLHMCNDLLGLGLTMEALAALGSKVGADVPFFVYGYTSANVSGIGEIVECFDEDQLELEIFTPKVEISTPKVYKRYREDFYAPLSSQEAAVLAKRSSYELLKSLGISEANDLYLPACAEYGVLKEFHKEGYFFSGSGSSFFKVKESNNG
jgi:4-diphosphocytidyl-2-C-methyl-D-erythritol kinase